MVWYNSVKWFVRTVFFGGMGGVTSIGTENVPKTGKLIVASIHISHMDPPLIGSIFPRTLRFMAKQELFKFPLGIILKSLLAFPVKRGESDTAAIRLALDEIEKGIALLMFPEGTRGDGEVLSPLQPGIALLAKKSGALVLPVGLSGPEKMLPKSGKLRRAAITVVYGKPLSYDDFVKSHGEKEGRQAFLTELERRMAEATRQAGLNVRTSDRSPDSTQTASPGS